MNKRLNILLCFVMVAALVLVCVCTVHFFSLSRQFRLDEQTLSDSRSAWEKTAAEKEELQKQLKSLKDKLKEAELSLSESTDRAEELRQDISALQLEIDVLKSGKTN